MWASYKGGATSRAGTLFVGFARQSVSEGYPPQLIPFQFSVDQGYVLVFSNREMSVVANGAYVTEDPFNISAVTNASPGVFTAAGNDFIVDDWVYLSGLGGMTELNGGTWAVNSIPTTGSFTLRSIVTADPIDTSAFGVYTGGGTAAKIFVLATPYVSADLQALKWAQSADVMSITHPSYAPADITRVSLNNWTLTTTSFSASIAPPATTTGSATAVTATLITNYSYVVTSIDNETGEESIASPAATPHNSVNIAQTLGSEIVSWSSVTGAGHYNVYKAMPAFATPVPIGALYGYAGSSYGLTFVDSNVQQDMTVSPPKHFNPFAPGAITSITVTATGSGYSSVVPPNVTITDSGGGSGAVATAVVVGGGVQSIFLENGGHDYVTPIVTIAYVTGVNAAFAPVANGNGLWDGGSSPANVTITNGGTGYTQGVVQVIAVYPFRGTTYTLFATSVTVTAGVITAVTFPATIEDQKPAAVDVVITAIGTGATGATASASIGPTTGTYPSCVAYFQQRRFYANTNNDPDTYYASQPGAFQNFDSSFPTNPSDAITGTPWGQQVNGIEAMVPMPGGLVILTGLGAWQLSGGTAGAALTPDNQVATAQAYNGTAPLIKPIVVNYDILYVQEKGSNVRDLSYNFFTNIYTGADLTVWSSHLFTGRSIVRWDWAEEPYKLVWAVRDDGILLSMTYLKPPAGSGRSEEDIYAWARHDTNGQFRSVCCVTEPPVDATYFVVERQIRTG